MAVQPDRFLNFHSFSRLISLHLRTPFSVRFKNAHTRFGIISTTKTNGRNGVMVAPTILRASVDELGWKVLCVGIDWFAIVR